MQPARRRRSTTWCRRCWRTRLCAGRPAGDEAFLYESSIDRTTYEELRDKLREELTLAELELSEAKVEQFDIDSALAEAIRILNNASALWIDVSLDDRLRLQEVLFPQGLVWDGKGFQTPVTCLSFYQLEPIEGSGLAPHAIDGVQTPPISLICNELGSESQAGVNDGTGTGLCERLVGVVLGNCRMMQRSTSAAG